MGKCAVIFHPVEVIGGGEKVMTCIAKVLRMMGYKVTLYTPKVEAELWKQFVSLLGEDVSWLKVEWIDKPLVTRLLERTGRFARLRWLLYYRKVYDVFEEKREECLVLDTRSNLPSCADIVYIHYPIVFQTSEKTGLHWTAYNMIVRFYAWRTKFRPGLVLANSKWTASHVYKAYKIVPLVVHPPVDVELFSKAFDGPHDEKMVVTVSRFTPEKNMERIVDVAARLRDYRFVVVGATGKYSGVVLESMRRRMRELKVDNVELLTNVPRDELVKIMARARYYLHPEFPEHFGIAVAEAMAAGLVPIVYYDGGAYYDLARRVSENLGYTRIEEVAEIVRMIDEHPKLWEMYSKRAHEIAQEFTFDKFAEKVRGIVRYVEEIKELARSSRFYTMG